MMATMYHEYAADMPHQILHMVVHCVRDIDMKCEVSSDGWGEIGSSINDDNDND